MTSSDLELAAAERPIERDGSTGLVGTVVSRLEALILTGAMSAGSKLNENALAQQFQVSRTALREAVRLLEHSGLVYIEPNRGVSVRKVSLKDALDLFDVRAGLAHIAGRLAVTRATDAQIGELTRMHDDLIRAREAVDYQAYHSINSAFHVALLAMTQNQQLVTMDEMVANQLKLFRRRNLERIDHLDASLDEHADILNAVKDRDSSRAGRAFEQHILSGRQRMLDTLEPDSIA